MKAPADVKPAVGSLGFSGSDIPELCPVLAIHSLPDFVQFTQFTPSPVHRLPPGFRCCRECDPGTGSSGARRALQLLSRDLQLLRANALGFEWL